VSPRTTRSARNAGPRQPQPPRIADWLLRRFLPLDGQNDAIRGDLLEEFRRRSHLDHGSHLDRVSSLAPRASHLDRASRLASRPSQLWYWRETLALIVRGHGYKKMLTLDNLGQDLRYAWRSYRKAPLFTLLVVLTLALGIGASTAIFSIVNGVLLRPLPFPDPERLTWVSEANTAGETVSVSWMNYLDWRARQHSFDALSASQNSAFTLTGSGQATRVAGRRVTANFFHVLGAEPALGRAFLEDEDRPGAPGAAIVSHEFWQRQLSADPNVLGRSLMLDGTPHAIVGVLPAGFRYLRSYDVFVAMGPLAGAGWIVDRGNHQGFMALGRLKPGVTPDAALTELRAIEADLSRTYPDAVSGLTVEMDSLKSRLVSDDRATLLVLFGSVGLLLLIACVNVANLLIARGASRRHELAVRAALGGKRLRLAMQLLIESSLLSAAGGAAGILLAGFLLRALIAVAPEGTPRLDEVALDGTALLFSIGAATACGLIFGAFPAAQASSVSGQQLVIRTRAAGAVAGSHRLRRGLLVAEVALALVLLTAAGLMVRTLTRLTGVDTGLKPDHLLTLRLVLPAAYKSPEQRLAVVTDLLARVRAVPGIVTAGAGYSLPIDGSIWSSSFSARDKPVPPTHDLLPSAGMIPVSDAYLEALGTRLTRGRLFTAADGPDAAPVAVINETLAAKVWPGEDPIGKFLKQGWPERPGPWRQVVGVIADIKFEGITEPTTMQVYMPLAQDPPADFTLALRTAVEPGSVRPSVEAIVTAISRDMPVSRVRTMEQVLDRSIARQRMALLVLSVFAAVALILAASGLYGLVAHSVTERTHEIGVRMALGAARRDVIRLVIVHGLSMTAAGIVAGVIGAAALSKSLQGLVFGVEPTDPATFAAVIAMLLAVAVAACYLPAWRATRIAPTMALRMD
jgi:putative ABC transport system permease protein